MTMAAALVLAEEERQCGFDQLREHGARKYLRERRVYFTDPKNSRDPRFLVHEERVQEDKVVFRVRTFDEIGPSCHLELTNIEGNFLDSFARAEADLGRIVVYPQRLLLGCNAPRQGGLFPPTFEPVTSLLYRKGVDRTTSGKTIVVYTHENHRVLNDYEEELRNYSETALRDARKLCSVRLTPENCWRQLICAHRHGLSVEIPDDLPFDPTMALSLYMALDPASITRPVRAKLIETSRTDPNDDRRGLLLSLLGASMPAAKRPPGGYVPNGEQ